MILIPLSYLLFIFLRPIDMTPPHTKSYGERAKNAVNPAAKRLFEIMERKKTNLAVSVDVVKAEDLLAIIEAVAPYVCLIKASRK